jgi:O-antigen ligase
MAYAGLLLYLGLVFIRPGDWVPAVLGWRLEFVVLGAIAAIVIPQRLSAEERVRTPQTLFLMGWVGAVTLSNLLRGNIDGAAVNLERYGKYAIVFLLILYSIDTRQKLKGVLLVMTMLSTVLAVQGISQKDTGIGWAGQPLGWQGRIVWVGLWDGPDVLSLVFMTSVPILLEFLLGPWPTRYRLYALCAGAITLEGLYLASSRGAWLSLFAVLLIYCLERFGKTGILVGTLLAVLLLTVAPSRLGQLSISGQSADARSSRYRISMWAEGLEMLRYYPILGIGKGEFGRYTSKLIAHNTFLEHMGETGLIGLFFSVGLVYFSFKSLASVRALGGTGPLQSLRRGLWASVISYLLVSVFLTTDWETFYIMLALCPALAEIARSETGQGSSLTLTETDVRNILMIEIGGIVFFYLITRSLSGG